MSPSVLSRSTFVSPTEVALLPSIFTICLSHPSMQYRVMSLTWVACVHTATALLCKVFDAAINRFCSTPLLHYEHTAWQLRSGQLLLNQKLPSLKHQSGTLLPQTLNCEAFASKMTLKWIVDDDACLTNSNLEKIDPCGPTPNSAATLLAQYLSGGSWGPLRSDQHVPKYEKYK